MLAADHHEAARVRRAGAVVYRLESDEQPFSSRITGSMSFFRNSGVKAAAAAPDITDSESAF
jgi:hypothetical protein